MTWFLNGTKHAALGLTAAGLVFSSWASDPAAAQAANSGVDLKGRRAAAFEAILDCRPLTDTAARLACYDAAATSLDVAEKKGDIVVVDREQAATARKQAFGFSLPSLTLFDRGLAPEEAERLTATLTDARRGADGRWVLTLEDGAVWRQIDDQSLLRNPKAGSQVKIRKAAMGSFFINIDGQVAMRASRSR
jgi:hypothetical protein